MKKYKKILLILLLSTLIDLGSYANDTLKDSSFVGEKIIFTIRKFGVKVGDAALIFNGLTQIKDRNVYLVRFTAESFNFSDEEKIYIDPQTFLPVVVQRNLNIFGKRENITEEYLPEKRMVKIVKTSGGKRREQILENAGLIDNIYCFIYRYRRSGNFKEGESLMMSLPTRDVKIDFVKKTQLKVARKIYDSFFLQSQSKDYQIWFDTSPAKIPLRIDGAVGLNSASLVIADYHK